MGGSVKLRRAITGIKAEIAERELDRIKDDLGALTPEVVVSESMAEDAPLHAAFEWDDAAAGHEFRLIQARNIIRSVHIVAEDGADLGCKYFHITTDDGSGEYVAAVDVLGDDDLFARAQAALMIKLDGARKALSDLERLAVRMNSPRAGRLAKAGIALEQTARELAAD